MNKTSRSPKGLAIPLAALLSALILSSVTGYFYLFRIDVTDVDGIYQTILLKNDGSELILTVLFAVVLTALVTLCLIFMKKQPPAPSAKEGLSLLFARCVTGAVTVATLIMYFVLSPSGTPYYYDPSPNPADSEAALLKFIVTTTLVLALPAALYFLLPALFSVKNKAVLFFSGLCTLLFVACELLLTHYFMIDFISSPTRVFAVFGYSSLALFLLLELKKLAYEQSGNRLRVILALLAFVLNTADALPRLVLSFMAEDPFSVTLTTFHTLFRLVMGVYALLSILPLFEGPGEEQESDAPKGEEASLLDESEPGLDENEEGRSESEEGASEECMTEEHQEVLSDLEEPTAEETEETANAKASAAAKDEEAAKTEFESKQPSSIEEDGQINENE